jgi:hypothetical protein
VTLGQRRRLFSRLIIRVLDEMDRRGYEFSLDEGFVGRSIDKPTEDTPHRRDGGHLKGIALDVNLFRCECQPAHVSPCPTPRYLTRTEDHEPFGLYWEALHPLCRWGGRFADGNHYSLEHGGVA